jgi:hypothetical protein
VNVSWITTGSSFAALAPGCAPPACVEAKPVAAIVPTAVTVSVNSFGDISARFRIDCARREA